LGLIGHNGAGKSTLLKMLNGLIKPDKGKIEMYGKVGALIELGAGFNPILTGRENIYANAAILGFSKKEVDEKFDRIVEFSEIGEFLDAPIQNYSSGMKVRLGFAVASQMEPDILIIDEVLAVGDVAFRLKCFNVIDELMDRCCIIFVSHSMQQISRVCTQILMMDKGNEKYFGDDVSLGLDLYYSSMKNSKPNFIRDESEIKIIDVFINGSNENGTVVKRLDDLIISIRLEILERLKYSVSSITILDHEQKPIGICFNELPLIKSKVIEDKGDKLIIELTLRLAQINLSKGLYSLTFSLSEEIGYKRIIKTQNIKSFQVSSERDVWPPIEFEGQWS